MNIVLDYLLLVATSIFLTFPVAVRSQDASLCYLKNGQSSEAFTVPETTPVGSDLGTLQFVGNAGVGGDIQVFVAPSDQANKEPPVAIRAHTQKLVLKTELDKEEETGISNFVINVSCHRTNSTDPDITIPVRIIVTDANDNAPVFIGSPYALNVSEVTVIGTTVMTGIRAVDKDQHGPLNTVEYYIERGPYSHLLAFENPLEGSLVLTGMLDFEALPTFSVTLRAQDQGHPPQSAFATLTVNVLDADDQNPRFLAERYIAHLPPNARPGSKLEVTPQPIKAEDTDIGIQAPIVYSFDSDTDEYKYFTLSPQSGRVYLSQPLPETMLLPVTLVIRATQVDNRDRYALTTLTVASDKPLPSELKFTQTDYVTTVLESTPVGQVVLTVQTTKTIDKNIRFQLLDNVDETFQIRESGELIIADSLDYEKIQFYAFRIMASDGKQSDIARVNITVMNVNDHDPTFNQTQYTFSVLEENIRLGHLIGKIWVYDKDLNDTVALSIKGPFENAFLVLQDGEIRISDTDSLNTTVCHLTVVAVDNGVPPRQASVPVTIQFPEEAFSSGSIFKPRKEDGSYVLLIVFGALLATLLVVIVTLTIYILKSKQYRDRLPAVLSSAARLHNNKVAASYTSSNNKDPKPNGDATANERNGVENPIFNLNGDANTNGAIPNGRTVVRSNTGSNFISAWNNEDLLPVRSEETNGEILANGNANKQNGDSILKESKIHNVQWPNGSIPRRVKKLSWEDEQFCRTELDPDVSVAPLGRTAQGQPDLTVYF